MKINSLLSVLMNFATHFPRLPQISYSVVSARYKPTSKVVLLASHTSHFLADILHRWHSKELDCEINCVIANHEILRSVMEWHEIPFFYVPTEKPNNVSAFNEIIGIIDQHEAGPIVLARFMQIIPSDMCERYMGRMINIHHSFLPSFKGANPYQNHMSAG